MHHRTLAAVAVAAASSAALADVTSIGEFDGNLSEGFEEAPFGFNSQMDVFGGAALVTGRPHATGSWTYDNRKAISLEGDRLMGSTSGGLLYTFDEAIYAFGGFFTSIAPEADGLAEFFDAEGESLGRAAILAPTSHADGQAWTWNGWAFSEGVSSVSIFSDSGTGEFLMQDDMRASTVAIPAPATAGLFMVMGVVGLRRRR